MSGSAPFDLRQGEFFPVLGLPSNAIEFTATIQATGGNCDLQVYGPDGPQIVCIMGGDEGNCRFTSSNQWNGMDIIYSSDDVSPPIFESIYIPFASTFAAIRVYAAEDCSGTVRYQWEGMEPCGETVVHCIDPPTKTPSSMPSVSPETSSPTSGPTTSPTTRPTPSPTTGPSKAPTMPEPTGYPSQAPTCHQECTDYIPEGEDKWYDGFGEFFTCDYYAQAPTELCTQTQPMFMNFGKTAREACCACNGNHDCGRVCDVVLMFKTCGGANSTTEAWPTATICDNNDNCQRDYYLDPREDILWANPLWPILAGTKYAWRVPTSMFETSAASVTLTAAKDGVCIEDVWIDYALVNDPEDPIFLSRTEDEFPGENVVNEVDFKAPECRKPSMSPTVQPTRVPTTPPTKTPSVSPLSCFDLQGKYEGLKTQYENQEQVCQDTQTRLTTLATTDGCDYGVTCARCDVLTGDDLGDDVNEPDVGVRNKLSTSDSRYDVVSIGSDNALAMGLPLGIVPIVGPQGTEMYISPVNEVWVRETSFLRRTCVEYKPSADQYCTDPATYCTDGNVVGTLAAIEEQVLIAMAQGDGMHPECPSSCRALSDDVMAHFIKMEVPERENICVWNNLYYYKDPTSRTRKFTCVAAGERLAKCAANTYLCVGFDDNTGMKTYGFYDWQAAAVKTALSLKSKVHPYCPSYANV